MTKKMMLALAMVFLSATVIARMDAQTSKDLTDFSQEWYVTTCETLEGLNVGVGIVRLDMTIEDVCTALGSPQFTITPQMVEFSGLYDGTILIYPDHSLYFKQGALKTVKGRFRSAGVQ